MFNREGSDIDLYATDLASHISAFSVVTCCRGDEILVSLLFDREDVFRLKL